MRVFGPFKAPKDDPQFGRFDRLRRAFSDFLIKVTKKGKKRAILGENKGVYKW
jgi:hypothetical protein